MPWGRDPFVADALGKRFLTYAKAEEMETIIPLIKCGCR
jgi:hypothetical protein